MTKAWEAFAVVVVVVTVLFAGCSGGFGPTLPSPDGAPNNDTPINDTPTNDPMGPTNTLCVRVTLPGGGGACENVVLGASDGETLWTEEQVVDGAHCFTEVDTGQLGLVVGLPGFATAYRQVTYPGGPQEVPVQMGRPVDVNPSECPVVTIRFKEVNQQTGTATVMGTATNTDSDFLMFFDNGQPEVIAFDGAGVILPVGNAGGGARTFTRPVVLDEGQNRFSAMVGNASCVVLSEQIEIMGEPISAF